MQCLQRFYWYFVSLAKHKMVMMRDILLSFIRRIWYQNSHKIQVSRMTNYSSEHLAPRLCSFFMLDSAEHEILNAHKYKNIKKCSFFSGLDKPRMVFFSLINVKMPTIGNKKKICSTELSMKIFITSGPGPVLLRIRRKVLVDLIMQSS